MTLTSLFVRFGLIYLGLTIGAAIVLRVIGMSSNLSLGGALALGATMWACQTFVKKNGRFFEPGERRRAVLGMLGVDLGLQLLLSSFALRAEGSAPGMGPMLFAFAFVGLLHAAMIQFAVGLIGKNFAKQQAQEKR